VVPWVSGWEREDDEEEVWLRKTAAGDGAQAAHAERREGMSLAEAELLHAHDHELEEANA
jgi:hypothetical protein